MPDLSPANVLTVQERIERLALHHDQLDAGNVGALIELPDAEALAFIEEHDDEITAARKRLELTGGTLEAEARRFAARVLARFHAGLDDLDTMEAANLLRHALRIIENADKVRAADKDSNAGLPVLHFSIGVAQGGVPVTIEAEAVEVRP